MKISTAITAVSFCILASSLFLSFLAYSPGLVHYLHNLIYTTDSTTPKLLPRQGSQGFQIRPQLQAPQNEQEAVILIK